MALHTGSRLGPYEVVAPLGAGGMGEVYRARDSRLGREVAVKILSDGDGSDPEHIARFAREARAVAALSHPNVMAIFDIGLGDVPFLVTELLTGETLRQLLDKGALGPMRTLELGVQLAAGLAAAHDRGIIHRDLKPGNLFVTTEGQVKILDFGLAKHVDALSGNGDDALPERRRAARRPMLGALGYMAPEQIRGLEVGHRADIFACGAILFEMVTGVRAFHHATPAETIAAILNDPPSSLDFPAGTPPALAATIRQCLEKDPNLRFPSARDLGTALDSIGEWGSGIGDRLGWVPAPNP